jgi:hypothetical protein
MEEAETQYTWSNISDIPIPLPHCQSFNSSRSSKYLLIAAGFFIRRKSKKFFLCLVFLSLLLQKLTLVLFCYGLTR